MTKRILISQHATIPHYRVRFYELLEQKRPRDWEFDVVFDTREAENPRLYLEPVQWREFPFSILDVRTHIMGGGTRGIIWQTFFWKARKYDAVITDNFVVHLTYMATHFWRLTGTRRAVWGHTRDRQTGENPGRIKRLTEWFKRMIFPTYNFFFAYTQGEAQLGKAAGFPDQRIAVLNNTIDILEERAAFERVRNHREELRRMAAIPKDAKVLLYVGRLIADKRIDFLADTFRLLHASDPTWRLVIVGDGPKRGILQDLAQSLPDGAVTMHGAVSDRNRLAPIYAIADLFIITGAVGLAPLQACCYNLPAVSFELSINGPESEYLNSDNGIVLPQTTTAKELAEQLPQVYTRFSSPETREGIYQSIAHLTMENMVTRFIDGVNRMLGIETGPPC